MVGYKVLLSLLAGVFKSTSKLTEDISSSMNQVLESTSEKIRLMTIRMFCGVVAVSVILFSLLVVGRQVNVVLLSLNNGPYLTIGFFVLAAALGFLALYFIFRPSPTSPSNGRFRLRHPDDNVISFKRILTIFLDSFIDRLGGQSNVHREKVPPTNVGVRVDSDKPNKDNLRAQDLL